MLSVYSVLANEQNTLAMLWLQKYGSSSSSSGASSSSDSSSASSSCPSPTHAATRLLPTSHGSTSIAGHAYRRTEKSALRTPAAAQQHTVSRSTDSSSKLIAQDNASRPASAVPVPPPRRSSVTTATVPLLPPVQRRERADQPDTTAATAMAAAPTGSAQRLQRKRSASLPLQFRAPTTAAPDSAAPPRAVVTTPPSLATLAAALTAPHPRKRNHSSVSPSPASSSPAFTARLPTAIVAPTPRALLASPQSPTGPRNGLPYVAHYHRPYQPSPSRHDSPAHSPVPAAAPSPLLSHASRAHIRRVESSIRDVALTPSRSSTPTPGARLSGEHHLRDDLDTVSSLSSNPSLVSLAGAAPALAPATPSHARLLFLSTSPDMRQRGMVVQEIYETERKYVRTLEGLCLHLVPYVNECTLLSSSQRTLLLRNLTALRNTHVDLFGAMDQLLATHLDLMARASSSYPLPAVSSPNLSTAGESSNGASLRAFQSLDIGRLFDAHSQELLVYADYCTVHEAALDMWRHVREEAETESDSVPLIQSLSPPPPPQQQQQSSSPQSPTSAASSPKATTPTTATTAPTYRQLMYDIRNICRKVEEYVVGADDASGRLRIEDYLIQPIQRITKYPLLLRQVMDATPTHAEELLVSSRLGLEKVDAVACAINDAKWMYERRTRTDLFWDRVELDDSDSYLASLPFKSGNMVLSSGLEVHQHVFAPAHNRPTMTGSLSAAGADPVFASTRRRNSTGTVTMSAAGKHASPPPTLAPQPSELARIADATGLIAAPHRLKRPLSSPMLSTQLDNTGTDEPSTVVSFVYKQPTVKYLGCFMFSNHLLVAVKPRKKTQYGIKYIWRLVDKSSRATKSPDYEALVGGIRLWDMVELYGFEGSESCYGFRLKRTQAAHPTVFDFLTPSFETHTHWLSNVYQGLYGRPPRPSDISAAAAAATEGKHGARGRLVPVFADIPLEPVDAVFTMGHAFDPMSPPHSSPPSTTSRPVHVRSHTEGAIHHAPLSPPAAPVPHQRRHSEGQVLHTSPTSHGSRFSQHVHAPTLSRSTSYNVKSLTHRNSHATDHKFSDIYTTPAPVTPRGRSHSVAKSIGSSLSSPTVLSHAQSAPELATSHGLRRSKSFCLSATSAAADPPKMAQRRPSIHVSLTPPASPADSLQQKKSTSSLPHVSFALTAKNKARAVSMTISSSFARSYSMLFDPDDRSATRPASPQSPWHKGVLGRSSKAASASTPVFSSTAAAPAAEVADDTAVAPPEYHQHSVAIIAAESAAATAAADINDAATHSPAAVAVARSKSLAARTPKSASGGGLTRARSIWSRPRLPTFTFSNVDHDDDVAGAAPTAPPYTAEPQDNVVVPPPPPTSAPAPLDAFEPGFLSVPRRKPKLVGSLRKWMLNLSSSRSTSSATLFGGQRSNNNNSSKDKPAASTSSPRSVQPLAISTAPKPSPSGPTPTQPGAVVLPRPLSCGPSNPLACIAEESRIVA
ncbi:hypothetical protein RI367_002203 [Sorochytrium milnesiophthora]